MPVCIRTVTDGDEAGDEDGGSGSECYECEVHVFLLWRARPGRPGMRRSNKAFGISDMWSVPPGMRS